MRFPDFKDFCSVYYYKLNILSINNIIEATIIIISPICIILFRNLNIFSIKNTWIRHIIGIKVFEIEKYPNKYDFDTIKTVYLASSL